MMDLSMTTKCKIMATVLCAIWYVCNQIDTDRIDCKKEKKRKKRQADSCLSTFMYMHLQSCDFIIHLLWPRHVKSPVERLTDHQKLMKNKRYRRKGLDILLPANMVLWSFLNQSYSFKNICNIIYSPLLDLLNNGKKNKLQFDIEYTWKTEKYREALFKYLQDICSTVKIKGPIRRFLDQTNEFLC